MIQSLHLLVLLGALFFFGEFVSASSGWVPNTATSAPAKTHNDSPKAIFRVLQVHIIHRHGDRTPITPMKDETFWEKALPNDELLNRISATTTLRREGKEVKHVAGGRGPFGKLTQLGLLQMVDLGSRLRQELHAEEPEHDRHHHDEHGNLHWNKGRLFDADTPLHPRHVEVVSTDFPRTIQSVQGLLVGLFPDPSHVQDAIEIDVRHTSIMIPDPQPRRSKEQQELEQVLAGRPHLQEREKEMRHVAVRVTEALQGLLGHDAFEVSYGVGEEHGDEDGQQVQSIKPLSWAQLAEITKCLSVRDLLPPGISEEDQETIAEHTAWRWFENLRHPSLSSLAMDTMVINIVESMNRRIQSADETAIDEAPLKIYSAHDSTLIGLLCAFRLAQPAKWPEYGSYLKMELLEVSTGAADGTKHHYVRFSLNGEVLSCQWEDDDESIGPVELIPVDVLTHKVKTHFIKSPDKLSQ